MNDFLLWLIIQLIGNPDTVPVTVLYHFYLWVYGIVPLFTGDYLTLLSYWLGY